MRLYDPATCILPLFAFDHSSCGMARDYRIQSQMKQISLCSFFIPDRLFFYFISASYFLLPRVLSPPQVPPLYTWHLLFLFFNMKFIVKLVSIQHPVVIPTGAPLIAHHPLSPSSLPPSGLSLFSVFKSLLWFASFPLCNFFLLTLPHGLLLSFSGST